MTIKRAAIYTRTVEGQDPDTLVLKKYCSDRGWEVVQQYHDKTLLGAKDRRPAQDRLLKDVKDHAFDVVVVVSLSEWGKALKHLIDSISHLKAQGISFVSVRDCLDLQSEEIFVRTVSALKNFCKAQNSERIKMGMMISRLRGQQFGRVPTPADQLAAIIAVYEQGQVSVRDIAKRTGVPRSTVHQTIKQWRAGEIDRQGRPFQSQDN